MRHFLLSLFAGLALGAAIADASNPPSAPFADAAAAAAIPAPAAVRLKVLTALRRNDAASLIEAVGHEDGLAGFLNEGADETAASVAEKIATHSDDEFETKFLQLWTTLAGADGVAVASAEWYPQWQAQVPQMLAGMQMAQTGMGESIASSTSMSAIERAQLTELQWAFAGWLSHTDFADRKHFEQVLGLARTWIIASGKAHPLELQLTGPAQRLQLADQAIASVKQALALYGLDADGILASVRIEQLQWTGDKASLRTSMQVLGVPLSFDEDLQWFEGEWVGTDEVAETLKYRAESKAEIGGVAPDAAAMALDQDPLFAAPAEAESLTGQGCHAPD